VNQENDLDLSSWARPGWRDEFAPGDIVELDLTILSDDEVATPNEREKRSLQAQGLRGVVIKSLGMHEDLAGGFDYLIWWDHKDPRYDVWFDNSWEDNRISDCLIKKTGEKDKRDINQLLEEFRKCFEGVRDWHGNNAPHFHEKGRE